MINVFQPMISQADLEAVNQTLMSGWLGKGQKVNQFEADFAAYIGVKPSQVVSINSCTEALFLAIELLDIAPGDEVIIPSIHFVGAAQAVIAKGAIPVFCDVDSQTLNTTLDHIAAKVSDKTAAVVLLHYGGVPCADTLIIKQWCDEQGVFLIEDSACSLGATLDGQACGTIGDVGAWSFDAMKLITTGDGGMMYFANDEIAAEARSKTYLGTDKVSGLESTNARWWEFEVSHRGARRSVMNDVAASLGIEQLRRVEEFIARRYEISTQYLTNRLDEKGNITGCSQVYFFGNSQRGSHYFFFTQTSQRDALAQFLRAAGVYTTVKYYPLHWAYKAGDSLPGAEKAARETLLLPLHCGLSDEDVSYICGKVREFYGSYK